MAKVTLQGLIVNYRMTARSGMHFKGNDCNLSEETVIRGRLFRDSTLRCLISIRAGHPYLK